MAAERVVIAGAGPAGLVLAWLLLRDGIPVLVIEREARETLGRLPKAGNLEDRTAAMLTREGLGTVLDFSTRNGRCEFRAAGRSVVLDYGEETGGRGHVVLPQHLFVQKMCAALLAAGGEVLFSHRVERVVPGTDGVRLTVRGPDGDRREIDAGRAVGCDGAGSTVAAAVTAAEGVEVHERAMPGRWLVISAATPPLVGHTIYAAHPRGFAGHIRRQPDRTRFYLEVPATDAPADWPADRLRAELAERLDVGDALRGVAFDEVGVLDLRVRVTSPMQHGRVFLVGDAAHLITPAGGKGMNLALGDAVELAHGLAEALGPVGDGDRLARYSETRLPAIWRTEAFSAWFLHIISATTAATSGAVLDGFGQGVRGGWVSALEHDPLLARWFAHAYAGVDPG